MLGPSLPATPQVRARMQRTLQRNNDCERRVRSLLHRSGLRFRIHFRPVPARGTEADIAFPRQRIAVMMDGCYWHGCLQHASRPRRNAEWWADKLDGNIARDRRNDAVLKEAGWQVMRFWEHEDPTAVASDVALSVAQARLAGFSA